MLFKKENDTAFFFFTRKWTFQMSNDSSFLSSCQPSNFSAWRVIKRNVVRRHYLIKKCQVINYDESHWDWLRWWQMSSIGICMSRSQITELVFHIDLPFLLPNTCLMKVLTQSSLVADNTRKLTPIRASFRQLYDSRNTWLSLSQLTNAVGLGRRRQTPRA